MFPFGVPGWVEVLVIAVIVLLLFGNRLPGVMRSLGSSIVEFKKGIKDTGDEGEEEGSVGEQRSEPRQT